MGELWTQNGQILVMDKLHWLSIVCHAISSFKLDVPHFHIKQITRKSQFFAFFFFICQVPFWLCKMNDSNPSCFVFLLSFFPACRACRFYSYSIRNCLLKYKKMQHFCSHPFFCFSHSLIFSVFSSLIDGTHRAVMHTAVSLFFFSSSLFFLLFFLCINWALFSGKRTSPANFQPPSQSVSQYLSQKSKSQFPHFVGNVNKPTSACVQLGCSIGREKMAPRLSLLSMLSHSTGQLYQFLLWMHWLRKLKMHLHLLSSLSQLIVATEHCINNWSLVTFWPI